MIDINKAQEIIVKVLPKITPLRGEINTKGTYLVFDSIRINNGLIGDIDYVFKLFVVIKTNSDNKKLAYQPLNDVLNPLLSAWEIEKK